MGSRPVPVRTILATIGLVLATYVALQLVVQTRRVLVWTLVAVFFAVALYPLVDLLERRVPRCRRTVATLVVFLLVAVLVLGLVTLFITPVAREGAHLAGRLPRLINDARAGHGPVGHLLRRAHVLEYVQRNEGRIRHFASGLGTPLLGYVRTAATTVAGIVTIFVLAYLMVLEGPRIVRGTMALVEESHAERIRRVGSACAKSITGYLSGNLLISVICGLLTYAVLLVTGVPFAGVIALFVAVADLIPLVGATLGAIVAGLAGFVHSVTAGIVVVAFFIAYQQVENHLLQPVIMSRTVKLNPLTVLLAVLFAADIAGILGALLAIPVAGMVKVVLADIWEHREHRPLPLPMGVDEARGKEQREEGDEEGDE
ncbi:AI-2E family transporter [Wenjunlia tyrosinilytica]|uniref:AI-2E family transporter n=1 Tax=Wenjunlia tyrosinilytica TaxID=1544741 RepID=A0A917ZYY5_9ACTN|nr:AI-2E family transporter [Wenjunlia tyrosinilytica]GGO99848.1 AI-2E family transporter [Wenjunlia tyrosinilytica]